MPRHDDWRSRLQATGHTAADLARRVNRSTSAINRIMTGGRADLKEREIRAIEEALHEMEGVSPRPAGLIPLLGYVAASGGDRIAWTLDAPLDWVEPPPIRSDQRVDLVALRVVEDSMFPRLYSGEVIYVGLNVAPARGGDCVVEFTDNTAVVKSYMARRDGWVFCHQYNPEREVKYEAASVRGLHAVLWRR